MTDQTNAADVAAIVARLRNRCIAHDRKGTFEPDKDSHEAAALIEQQAAQIEALELLIEKRGIVFQSAQNETLLALRKAEAALAERDACIKAADAINDEMFNGRTPSVGAVNAYRFARGRLNAAIAGSKPTGSSPRPAR
jgi:hypothetical protein